MYNDENLKKDLRNAGKNCIALGVIFAVGVFGMLAEGKIDGEKTGALIFMLVVAILSFVGGISFMKCRKWGYVPASFSLFLMFFLFPIGTIFSLKSIRAVKEGKHLLK